MCKLTDSSTKKNETAQTNAQESKPFPTKKQIHTSKKRRSKRTKECDVVLARKRKEAKRRIQSLHSKKKSGDDDDMGGFVSFLPSLALLFVAAFAVMAKMGFRGRPTTAGIDLGTTNSVICIQSPSKSVGKIECINDPNTNSPIIPSVVSFLDRPIKGRKKSKNKLKTPSTILVGKEAKDRIDTHPKSTFYHAKRVIGRTYSDPAISELRHEVEFHIERNSEEKNDSHEYSEIIFHSPESGNKTPSQISSHVLTYLLDIASEFSSSYSSLTSAVIAIPAEFSINQRIATVQAFKEAGIKVARILEEPTAAALAYGLDQKEGVEHILVYDFGGGTLDVSVLRVSPDGFVDVMGSAGDSNLGGVDFDTKVADYLLNKEQSHILILNPKELNEQHSKTKLQQRLEQCGTELDLHPCTETGIRIMAERMKIKLSNLYDTHEDDIIVEETCLSHSNVISNDSNYENLDKMKCNNFSTQTITLSLTEYDMAVSDLYPRSILPVRSILHDLDMKLEDIDEVVMVGGTTRMPQIRNLVKKEFEGVIQNLNTDIDPDLTVAYGAASVID